MRIFLTAACPEEDYLKPSKTKLREQKMIAAESMRKDEMPIDDIAIELGVPEGTVKRWVAGIGGRRGTPLPNPSPKGEGLNTFYSDEDSYTPSPSRERDGTPPLQGESLSVYLPKVLPVDWEDPSPTLPLKGGLSNGFDFYAKPVSLTNEEWATCVNNPDSPNYDPFAYNPYLIENEQREMGLG